MSIKCFEAEA